MKMNLFRFLTIVIVFSIAFTPFDIRAQLTFQKNISLGQAIKRAENEKKAILVYMIPVDGLKCDSTLRKDYLSESESSFLIEHFVCIKVPVSYKWNKEDQPTKLSYTAQSFPGTFFTHSYPFVILFSSDGNLAGRVNGQISGSLLIEECKAALKPDYLNIQLDRLNGKYQAGARDEELVQDLCFYARWLSMPEIYKPVFENYLLNSNDKDIYKRQNLFFIESFMGGPDKPGFKYFFGNENRIDAIVGRTGFAANSIAFRLLVKEMSDIFKVDFIESWDDKFRYIKEKYNEEYAYRVVLEGKIKYYSMNGRVEDIIAPLKEYTSRFGSQFVIRNDDAMLEVANYIFKNSNDVDSLNLAADWAKRSFQQKTDENDRLNLYAALLFKMGLKKDAIRNQEMACSLLQSDKNLMILNAMKRDEKGWEKYLD